MAAAGVLIAVGAAGCGGDDSKTDPTPLGAFVGGRANATLQVGDKAMTFEDGICTKGPDNKYLTVNIGNPAAEKYFGMSVGAEPNNQTTRSAAGGGEFSGRDEVLINLRYDQTIYLLRFDDTKVTLQPDLNSGQLTGRLTRDNDDGSAINVSGSFTCPADFTPQAVPTQ
jgi:hypothetical protein